MSSDLIAKWKACGQNKSDLNYENKLADFYNVFRNSLFFLEIVPIPEEGECLRFIPIPEDGDNPVILPAYSTANENQFPANILGMMQGTERDFTPANGDFILSSAVILLSSGFAERYPVCILAAYVALRFPVAVCRGIKQERVYARQIQK